ncbi:hypothetical protein AAEX28_06490 [Lentisphaerota bacterium WC36G]|nr:hypothetical protein LJT99_09355 [Lentisphaerae bacterium WC36]
MSTYTFAAMFFEEKLCGSTKNYYKNNWVAFSDFFDSNCLTDQFQFSLGDGKFQGMYSWANPGYARLNSLSKVVGKLESRYNLMVKQPLLALIRVALNEGFSFMEKRLERGNALTALERDLNSEHNNALPEGIIIAYFKNFIRVVVNKNGKITANKMSDVTLRHLNTSNYRDYRTLIDPEKEQLTFDDLISFTV